MGEGGYKIRDQHAIHFITFAVVNWIDVFTRQVYKDIIVESLRHCQLSKGLILYAWIIMPNHMHMIIAAKEGYLLSNILRDFKKYTSTAIIYEIEKSRRESRKEWMLSLFSKAGKENIRNVSYQFWQQDNHPIELKENNMKEQKLDYIHYNPVKAGIVDCPSSYLYSSAKNYAGEKGILAIEFL